MRKFTVMLVVLLFAGLQVAFAQTTVNGTVTSAEDGQGIPGVTVLVKGTSVGTTSDVDGNYTISVPDGGTTLLFSFVGMVSQEVEIGGQTTINVTLEPATTALDEVVVTALGISREKKALGYSVQEVEGAELMVTKPTNIVNSLSGKVAGVQVTAASGAVGASSRVQIRGNSSLRSDNQPLYVVDGTPISNFSTNVSQWGGADFGNASMDIDPENIESISVLKGASAAALYGSRALNGVILITTKKGTKTTSKKQGIGVSFSAGVSFDNVFILPDYQNKYGQATHGSEYYYKQFQEENPGVYANYQEYIENESFSYYDGNWGGVNDGWDESWGGRLDIGLKLPQFNSPYTLDANGNPVYTPTPWVSNPDNVKDFYETGITQSYNLTVSGSGKNAFGRISYTLNDVKGMIPNTDLKKNSVNLAGTYFLGKRLSATANITYVNNTSDNLPGGGYDAGNVMQSIGGWFGRQVDMKALKDNWDTFDPFGKPYTWSYYYHNNPYWTVNKNTTSRERNRVFGNVGLKYEIMDWMNLNFRAGTDYWAETRKRVIWNQSNENKNNGGQFWEEFRIDNENNVDVYLDFDKHLSADFRLSGLVGANYRENNYQFTRQEALSLTVPNFFDISNVSGTPLTDMYKRQKRTNSVYANVDASYRDFLFVGATLRNDWSSTLPANDWSYLYPSVNLGFIFTQVVDIDPKILSFGKIRASYAVVGGDADPYSLYQYYVATTAFQGTTQYHYIRDFNNPALKPEQKNAWELGLDLKFYNNRFGLDFTYYDEKTKDQIMPIDVATSSGFASRWINAGELQNKGVEISAYADIYKPSNDGFKWRVMLDWAKNTNYCNELYGDLEAFQIGSSWSGLSVEARPGEKYGVIKAVGYVRDGNGAIIVDNTGRPIASNDPQDIGNIQADWVGGMRNMFSYKGFDLYIHIDGRKGGDIFSVSKMFGLYAGILEETAQGTIREDGVIAGQNVMTDETFVIAEYTEDGQLVTDENGNPVSSGKINDIVRPAESFFKRFYAVKEKSIIDASYIKLREISLGYNLSPATMEKISWMQSLNVSLFARNVALLWTHKSNDVKIDPETGFGLGNSGVGLEQYQLAPARTIGVKLTATF